MESVVMTIQSDDDDAKTIKTASYYFTKLIRHEVGTRDNDNDAKLI